MKTNKGIFLVLKFGSGLIVRDKGINREFLVTIADQVKRLWLRGVRTIIIGSGAIATGKYLYQDLSEQKEGDINYDAAFWGQSELLVAWHQVFEARGLKVTQRLLVDSDLDRGKERLAQRLKANLDRGIILLNGDDTRLTKKNWAANNDYLAYKVGDSLNADVLVNLTNVDGVLDREGNLIRRISSKREINKLYFGEKSATGTGGMGKKVEYIFDFVRKVNNRVAYIANGQGVDLIRIIRGESECTKVQIRGSIK